LGLAGFFTIFSNVGVDTILTREASHQKESAPKYFANAFWIKIFFLSITAVAIIFFAPYFSNIKGAETLLPLIAVLIFFDNIRELCVAYFRAQEKMEYEALVTTFTNISITVFGFLILAKFKTSQAVTIMYISGAGAGMFLAAYIIRREFKKVFRNFSTKLIKEILNASWAVSLYGIAASFMLNTDVVMLGWFRSANEIGFYSAGQRIILILYTLPTIFASSTFPLLARLIKNSSHAQIRILTEKILLLIFLMAIPLCVGGAILGKSIMYSLYGGDYVAGAIAFQILSLAIIFVFPTIALGNLILGFNQQKKMTIYVMVASLSNIVFNAALIPFYGIAGAAIATVFAQGLYNWLMWRFSKKLTPFYVISQLKKIAVASLFMGIFAFTLQQIGINVFLIIAASVMLYFSLLYLFKEPAMEDVKIFIKALKK